MVGVRKNDVPVFDMAQFVAENVAGIERGAHILAKIGHEHRSVFHVQALDFSPSSETAPLPDLLPLDSNVVEQIVDIGSGVRWPPWWRNGIKQPPHLAIPLPIPREGSWTKRLRAQPFRQLPCCREKRIQRVYRLGFELLEQLMNVLVEYLALCRRVFISQLLEQLINVLIERLVLQSGLIGSCTIYHVGKGTRGVSRQVLGVALVQ